MIQLDSECEQMQKQILTELRTLHNAHNKHIVQYHQSFLSGSNVTICMEYMDGGSLADTLFKHPGAKLSEQFVAEIARQVGC